MSKKLLIILQILLFNALQVSAQSNVGLIAHWPFNGNAMDSTGNGHNGTASNTTMGQGITGQPNTAYYFNGTSSNIDVPYQADLNITRYSICTVMKPMGYYTGACQGNFIVSRSLEGSAGCYFLEFFDNAYDGNDCGAQDTSKNVFAAGAGSTSGNITNWQCTPHIVSNTWYTVIATYDGSNIKIYVDGVLKSTYPVTVSTIASTFDDLYIGFTGRTSVPYWFKGYLDDLRLYNRVLADSEIKQYATKLYMKNSDTVCKGTSYMLQVNMINGSFVQTPGTLFTVERSDLSGSFSTPVTIGTYSVGSSGSTGSVIVPCIVSTATIAGHYKLRTRTSTLAIYSEESDLYVYDTVASPSALLTASGVAPFPYGSPVTFTANVANAGPTPAFKWYKNSVLIPGQTTGTYTALAGADFINADTISVVVKTSLPCSIIDTVKANIGVTLGIPNNSTADGAFTIYPNPNKGSFRIKGYANTAGIKLEVLNTVGQIVYSETLTTKQNLIDHQVSLPGINSGIYFVRLQADGVTKTMRLIVQQ